MTMQNTSTSNGGKTNQPLLNQFFFEELRDVYGAEKLLTIAIPKLQEAATSPDLAMAFADHLQVTLAQISRLEEIFSMVGEEPDAKKCEGMEGLIRESQTVIKDTEQGTFTRDVGLIVAAQKVEHYEIAAYGSLRQLAKTIGKPEISQLLEETLEEEKETDMLLSNLAETLIIEEAKQETPQ
jgi:ferritin-like metal-binding protein YciE